MVICLVRSLPYKITAEDMYDIFGKYGAIRQIRLGSTNATRGTAYVVYDDIHDAKNAFVSLNGFQVAGRYLVVSLKHNIWKDKKSFNTPQHLKPLLHVIIYIFVN